MSWLCKKIKALWEAFFYKGGKISKTAIFLSLFSLALLGMWIFQGLFVGAVFFGWWTIPEFNVGAATAVMTIFSALYVLNHNKHTGTGVRDEAQQIADLRGTVERVAAAVQGNGAAEETTETDNGR